MSTHSSITAVMLAAVQASPEDLPLRLHLASLLLEGGDHAGALEQFTEVLSRDPAHLDALRGAAVAAEGAEDRSRAQGYRRLLSALEGSMDRPARPAAAPPGKRDADQ